MIEGRTIAVGVATVLGVVVAGTVFRSDNTDPMTNNTGKSY